MVRILTKVAAISVLCLFASTAPAATTGIELFCPLNDLTATTCQADGVSYGTIILTDVANGMVSVKVDLLDPALKFRDMVLNYFGVAAAIFSEDGQAFYSSNNFGIQPYSGRFDLGDDDAKGWEGSSGYMTILRGEDSQGAPVPLTVDNFDVFDSDGKIKGAVHIQNIGSSSGGSCDGESTTPDCVPGQSGPGSLKVGGLSGPLDIPEAPEPATLLMMAAGLFALGSLRRK